MLKVSPALVHAIALPVLAGCLLFVAGCGSASDSGEPSASAGSGADAAGSVSTPGGTGGAFVSGGAGGVTSGVPSGGSGGSSGGGRGSAGSSASLGGTSGSSGNGVGGSGGSGGSSGVAGVAGSGGSGGSTPNNDYLKTHTRGYGFVEIAASSKNQILSLTTTLTVPSKPTQNTGTLFLWPGLQPGGQNYEPIDNGVLQPVLTWGPTCAPTAPKNGYASWWVSAQYVNTFGSDPGYTGCLGGSGMNVQVGDALRMVMTLDGTVWHQTVTDAESAQSVSYDLDMLGQAQNYAEFVIEMYTENPATDVVFTATSVTFENAEPASCQPSTRGMNDFFSNPQASPDGKVCSIDRIVLRAEGVPATTPN